MQNIIYVNAYGESVAFSSGPPVLLRSVSGLSRPEAEIVSAQGAYLPGAMISRVQLPMRRVDVRFDMLPQETREAYYALRMRMEHVLSASRCMRDGQTGMIIYENDAGRWQTNAVPEGSIVYGKRVGNAACDNRVSFLCPNPYLFSGTREASQLRMGKGGLSLPSALPVNLGSRDFKAGLVNLGTADAPVTVTIYGTGGMPSLLNHTTGAVITVMRRIAYGEKLVVSTEPAALSCVLIHADGTPEDAFGYLDPSTAVSAFVLVPGTNEVEYLPGASRVRSVADTSAGSRVEIAWRSCYEGV